MLGLLMSHAALAPAATRNSPAGTMVRMVSSKRRVKSKDRASETGPKEESELFPEDRDMMHEPARERKDLDRPAGHYRISTISHIEESVRWCLEYGNYGAWALPAYA